MDTIGETEIEAEHVERQLERILADRRFAGAERTARFLRYVVEKTLAGAASEIKEIVIATDLYQRSSDYDPKIDSMVRVEAKRLRTKLSSYYQQQGRRDPIAITIPKGSYVPRFEWREVDPPSVEVEVVSVTEPMAVLPPAADPRRLVSARSMQRVALAAFSVIAICLLVRAATWEQQGTAAQNNSMTAGAPPEAFAAWEEGNALLQQDPHTGSSEHGAPQTLLRAIERFEYAVARAPAFARAWASLAEAYEYAFPYVGRDPANDAMRAEAAARRAVALDGRLAIAHANLALVLFYLRWDLAGAETEYRRALALDSRLPYAVVELADLLRETGRPEQAEMELRKARALLPALPVLASKQAEVELDRHKIEEAIATATSAIHLKRDYGRAYVVLGMAYQAKGLFADALERHRMALAMDNQDRRALPSLGYALAKMGREEEARDVLQQLIRMNTEVRNCAFQVALVYTGLGDYEHALDWLETAYKTRQMHVPFAGVESRFKPLRSSPRFRAIISRLGLRALS